MTLLELYEDAAHVRCYFNLHKKLWSVTYKGKVIDHVISAELKNATWSVQPAGNAKVRREGRKNVHAFCSGTLVGFSKISNFKKRRGQESVTYNPYKHTSFVWRDTSTPVYNTKTALLTGSKAYAS